MRANCKALFFALYKEYYCQFLDGTKTAEYRKYGSRWNLNAVYPGREVTP